ncbi:hypothetical protein C0584_01760 [Candidatus Parcubacteria bacterium]|nr:MAG: hypothetical protein C0584_01760 [Candidatus Parcubacteria bacterium]
MKISIIIPTFNRATDLEETLLHIYKQKISRDNFEVIIVDNGPSSDNTEKIVLTYKEKYRNIVYIKTSKPGVTYARELGSVNANFNIHLQIDDDTSLVQEDTLSLLISLFENKEISALTGSEKVDWAIPERSKVQGIGRITNYGIVNTNFSDAKFEEASKIEIDHARSCFLAYRSSVFKKINGFDCYYDDLTSGMGFRGETDFCIKIKNIGAKIFLTKKISYVHRGAMRPKRVIARNDKFKRMYYVYLTHSLFVLKNLKLNKLKWFFFQLLIGTRKVPGAALIIKKRHNPLIFFFLLFSIFRILFITKLLAYKETK